MNPTAEDILNNVVGWSNEITEDMAIEAMLIYADLMCDEQAFICADHADTKIPKYTNDVEVDRDSIINAPKPELK